MKTKYVKVPVSERLPEKSGFYIMFVKNNPIPATRYFAKLGFNENLESWLEPVPDHSEEMLDMLEIIKRNGSTCDWAILEKDIEKLINKVKENG